MNDAESCHRLNGSAKRIRNLRSNDGFPGDTISLGIGQGQNTFTPLQMAHAMATLVNGGVVMKPHLVKISLKIPTQGKSVDGTKRKRTYSFEAGKY